MRKMISRIFTAVLITLSAGILHAEFRVADLIYVPVVAHTSGVNDSLWRSDVKITSMEQEDLIDVALVLLPSGLHSNSSAFYDRTYTVGGREEDGFGIIDPDLADIQPGATVVLEDVIAKYWPDQTGLNGQGALVIFSYLAGSLQDDGSREYRNIMVTSRTYNIGTIYAPDPENEGEFIEETATYGQAIPGVPWYDVADGGYLDETRDFTYMWLDGAEQTEEFRYNLGLFNASDSQTSLIIRVEPFQSDGQPFLGETGLPLASTIQMPPLSHLQYFQILGTMFGLTDVSGVKLKLSIVNWSSTGVESRPAFTAYGSLIDNISNDPTTYTPTFAQPFDISCMWPDPPEEGEGKSARSAPERLKFPPR